MITTTDYDGFKISFFDLTNRYGAYYIDLFECISASQDDGARFLAAPPRGYPTHFDLSLIGQASTAAEAIAMCRDKVQNLLPEEIQETPPGCWLRIM